MVAKGYAQREGIDYNEVFSPVVKHSSIRILLALVAQNELDLDQLDVKTAFLHGDFEEEIYMTLPTGYKATGKEELVCKLKKSLYGLKQSPRRGTSDLIASSERRSTHVATMIHVCTTTGYYQVNILSTSLCR